MLIMLEDAHYTVMSLTLTNVRHVKCHICTPINYRTNGSQLPGAVCINMPGKQRPQIHHYFASKCTKIDIRQHMSNL